MKRKLLLITILAMVFICAFAISISARELTEYCDAKITLTSGETVTAYFEMGTWKNGLKSVQRDNIYKSRNTDDGKYNWDEVVVLDFRNCNYTENYPPETMNGTGCNGLATNVTTIYFPEELKMILNTSFTGGWKSLDTVYIPASMTEIDHSAFTGSPIRNVYIEENSQLTRIGDSAFRGCSNLTFFDFSKTQCLERIEYCAFFTSGLSGNVVVPNSVTYMGDAAFRATQVESIVLGDGVTYLGYNLVGNDGGTSKTNLKEIYISAKSTFNKDHLSEIWFTNGSIIDFYVIGDNDAEINAFITSLKGTGRVKFATEEEIANGATGYNAIIYKRYDKCEVFYNGNHEKTDEGALKYTDAVTEFYKATKCAKCGVEMKTSDTYAPILTFLGYSIKNDGSALCVGYDINKASYKVYTETFGKTLEYGVICAVADEQNDYLEIKDGEVSVITGKKALCVAVDTAYSSFEFKLTGFTTEKYMNTAFVVCAYSYDGASIKYLFESSQDTPIAVSFSQINQ